MRIDLAYCAELDQTIDIYTACLEYSRQDTHGRFSFFCSDPACRASVKDGVRVTAVNYQYLPEDEEIKKSPHFRKLDAHSPECEWTIINSIINEGRNEKKENIQGSNSGKAKRIITRFIVPNTDSIDSLQSTELNMIRQERNPLEKKRRLRQYVNGAGSTATSLESLVSCYEELKSLALTDEKITVVGYGTLTFWALFKNIKYASDTGPQVIYGAAKLYKRYGTGFSLNLFDKFNERQVRVYISTSQINSSRYGPRLKRIIDEIENRQSERPYLKIYWIGSVKEESDHYSISVDSLSHIVLRIAIPKTQKST